jgi:hypothetical protein
MGIIPISASAILTLSDVAKHWSQESLPRREIHELVNEMLQHWWLGNLQLQGPSRLEILKLLREHSCEELIFFVLAEGPPVTCVERDDGSVDVDIRKPVPIPSSDTSTWSEANCAEAFGALAELEDYRDCGDVVTPVFHAALVVTEPAFRAWLVHNKVNPPKFWKSSEVSNKCQWTADDMEKWWKEEGYTNSTKARDAFMDRADTKNCTALFEQTWQERNRNKRGRPRKQ